MEGLRFTKHVIGNPAVSRNFPLKADKIGPTQAQAHIYTNIYCNKFN
jgi:hypothetical protein